MAETKNELALAVDNKFIDGLTKQLDLKAKAGFVFPPGYSVSKELTAAYLVLKEAKDRNQKPLLEVCTPASVASSLMDMATLGLSAQRKQGYFIAYGSKCIFQRSYFGNLALAHRCGMKEVHAEVIYKDDEFEYEIVDGIKKITKHKQNFLKLNPDDLIGAYAIVTLESGEKFTEIMNMEQIRKSWGQGATKGASPAHKNFPDQMAKKTVINRALKITVNSSPEGWLTETESYSNSDEVDESNIIEAEIEVEANKELLEMPIEEANVAELDEKEAKSNKSSKKDTKAENEQISLDDMGF